MDDVPLLVKILTRFVPNAVSGASSMLTSNFPLQSDGRYIHFKLRDRDMAFVNCAVEVEFRFMRGLRDGVRHRNSSALFLLYKKEIEQMASEKFDVGAEQPLITASDLAP